MTNVSSDCEATRFANMRLTGCPLLFRVVCVFSLEYTTGGGGGDRGGVDFSVTKDWDIYCC